MWKNIVMLRQGTHALRSYDLKFTSLITPQLLLLARLGYKFLGSAINIIAGLELVKTVNSRLL